jgi:diguanylate cyclase (GGDEF)-like protein
MVNSIRQTRYVTALAVLSLSALLLTPFLFKRHVESLRREITTSLEPARVASADIRLSFAREVAAIRGFLLTADRALLREYSEARGAERDALDRIALVPAPSSIVTGFRDLATASKEWNEWNQRLSADSIPVAVAVQRLPDQQLRYKAALDASDRLEQEIGRSLADLRERIERAERWWATATVGLGLLAAGAAVVVILMLRTGLAETALARTDALTGLHNRRGFSELVEHELKRSQRNGTPVTLVNFDLDGFKAINDQRGHAAGDKLLVSVARGIMGAIRGVDLSARLGGDEFAVLLTDNKANPPELAVARVRDVIIERLRRDEWPVTLSVGAVTVRDSARDVDTLIHEADVLMYQAKKAGKNSLRHQSLIWE